MIAVNAGSNTVSVLGPDDDGRLCLRQVLASGGTFPVSVTVQGNLLYVLNAHETGAITGYRITDGKFDDRGLHPLPGADPSHRTHPGRKHTGPGQLHP